MTQVLVTAAIVEKEGKFLLTKRKPDQHNAGRWEFPGGVVEQGEDLRQCLEREIFEELGIKVRAGEVFEISSYSYGEKHVVLISFETEYVSGTIQHLHVADHAWVSQEKLNEYDITEADLQFVRKIRK